MRLIFLMVMFLLGAPPAMAEMPAGATSDNGCANSNSSIQQDADRWTPCWVRLVPGKDYHTENWPHNWVEGQRQWFANRSTWPVCAAPWPGMPKMIVPGKFFYGLCNIPYATGRAEVSPDTGQVYILTCTRNCDNPAIMWHRSSDLVGMRQRPITEDDLIFVGTSNPDQHPEKEFVCRFDNSVVAFSGKLIGGLGGTCYIELGGQEVPITDTNAYEVLTTFYYPPPAPTPVVAQPLRYKCVAGDPNNTAFVVSAADCVKYCQDHEINVGIKLQSVECTFNGIKLAH